jgi:hypothetical protein
MEMQRSRRRDFLVGCAAASAACGLGALRAAAPGAAEAPLDVPVVDCRFPGGNICVERIEGDDVYLHQDQRDTPSFWFYWYFRVRQAAGRTLRFQFTMGNVLGVRGPAVSTDGGKNWNWLGAESIGGASFTYAFPASADEVRFCLAMPYLEADLENFLARWADNPHLKAERHSTTRKGRVTRRLRLGRFSGAPQYRVLLTCRHHACEMMASWALQGIMELVLTDSEDGQWFRDHVELLVLPFMDKDGVEDGDQGKNRTPHDPNRDYLGTSIYPSVAALRRFVPEWAEGRLRIALDMHCPWIRGGGDEKSSNQRIFFVGNPAREIWDNQQEFCKVLQEVQTGPLVYKVKHNLPWGEKWNTLKEPRSCSRWAAELPEVLFASTVEIPYADVAGAPVTPATAQAFGRDLARAMRAYLESQPMGGADL